MKRMRMVPIYKAAAVAVVAIAAVAAGSAYAQSAVLTDNAGMALYISAMDSVRTSQCYGACAAPQPTTDFRLISRDGEVSDLAARDRKPEDARGDTTAHVGHLGAPSEKQAGSAPRRTFYIPGGSRSY